MVTISASEFKATCLSILDKVERTGEPVLITKRGKPVAQVVPPPAPEAPVNWLGCMKGTIQAPADFDWTAPVLDSADFGDADWSNVRKGLEKK